MVEVPQVSPAREFAAERLQHGLPSRAFRLGQFCFFFLVIGLLALRFASTLDWPFGRDQGILAWAGGIVFRGGMPYRDAWEIKGPTAILPYTFLQWLFGPTMRAVRVLDLLLTAGNLAALYYIARRWWNRRAAVYALIVGALVAGTMDFWVTAQPDLWCGFLIAFAVVLMGGCVDRVRLLRLCAASVLIGICVLQKPIYLLAGLLFLPALIWAWRDRTFWRTAFGLAGAFLLPVIVTAAWFARHGALGSLVDVFILFNLRTHSQLETYLPHQQFMMFVSTAAQLIPFNVCMLPALLGGVLLARAAKWPAVTYFIWIAVGLTLVVIQKKYFLYHWYPLIAPVVIGTGIALSWADEIVFPLPASWRVRLTAGQIALCWITLLYLPLSFRWARDWVMFRFGNWSRAQYESNFYFENKNYYWFSRIRAISDHIQSRTTANQSVLVWGFDPVINYLTGRPSPTRFGYSYPLEFGSRNPFEVQYRQEFLSQVEANPPEYVVVADKDQNLLVTWTSKTAFEQFLPFRDFVEKNYAVETLIDDWVLWRRKR